MKFAFLNIGLALIMTSVSMLAVADDDLFFEMNGEELARLQQATNGILDAPSEKGDAWYGLVFDTQLTHPRDTLATLTLSSGLELFLERESLEAHPLGFKVWSGLVFNAEGASGHAQLFLVEGGVEGHISIGQTELLLTSLGQGLHRIEQASGEGNHYLAEMTDAEAQPNSQRAACLQAPNLTLNSDFCRGFTTASWTAVAGATYYELRVANTSILLYSGSATSRFVDFGCCSNRFLHVRACNSGGCGDFSASRFARYYSICL